MALTKQNLEGIEVSPEQTISVITTSVIYEDGKPHSSKKVRTDYPVGTPLNELPAGKIRAIANLIWG